MHRSIQGDDRSAYLEKDQQVTYEAAWDDRKGKHGRAGKLRNSPVPLSPSSSIEAYFSNSVLVALLRSSQALEFLNTIMVL